MINTRKLETNDAIAFWSYAYWFFML